MIFFLTVQMFPFILNLLRDFYWELILILSDAFPESIQMMTLIFSFNIHHFVDNFF